MRLKAEKLWGTADVRRVAVVREAPPGPPASLLRWRLRKVYCSCDLIFASSPGAVMYMLIPSYIYARSIVPG